MSEFLSYINSPEKPIIVFDGATGTSLQNLNLKACDFGGEHLEGCNENLCLESPDSVEYVHKSFLEVGCDVIETNTFGATSIVLDEYGIKDKAYDINFRAAQIAKKQATLYSKDKPRFVAGSIGPTTKLPTLGHINFDELRETYFEQAKGLVDGNVDLILIETCQDVLQIKAALQGVKKAIDPNNKIPIMVSVTMETTGRMLVGTDINTVLTILEPFDLDILGLNCATGPEQMKSHIEYLSINSPFKISCIPNAGLPENIGGIAHYKLTPIEMKMQLMNFVYDYGVQLIGGCCGTTPNHIKYLADLALEFNNDTNRPSLVKSKREFEPSASSIYESIPYKQDKSFLIVGERLNASGSKKVRELLNSDDWDGLITIAKNQLRENAHVLDVNVDFVGRDGVSDMNQIVRRLVKNINLPLMLDSTDYEKMESGLKQAGGKCILNSTNFEDGPDRFFKVLELARDYGAGIVIGTIDESGMARTAEKKLEIALRAFNKATEYGISPTEIFYDPLALPISTGLEEDRKNGQETIKAIKKIKEKLPLVHIILGISNISFGLNQSARIALNSVFLNEAIKSGMDSAIVSPSKILPLTKFSKKHIQVCYDLIYDRRKFIDNICQYDPLTELTTLFANVKTNNNQKISLVNTKVPIEERLKSHIIDGEKENLHNNLTEALKKYKPLVIINKFLLDGMKVVGDLFGSGQMQLPFVLQSAETMKYAVSFLEPYMDKSGAKIESKGRFIIATVKGDVHDIGKNLVDIILTNNGYEVINLGIKQEVSAIIEAQKQYEADCIAMSGLLVKSTAFMMENLAALNDEQISIPVILGGAALTPNFVNKDCASVYKGKVIYGKDAFTDLKFMDSYMKAKQTDGWDNYKGFLNEIPEGIFIGKGKDITGLDLTLGTKPNIKADKKIDTSRSDKVEVISKVNVPFEGTKCLLEDDLRISDIVKFLDKKALFSGQWQIKRSRNQSKEEYQDLIKYKAEPILKEWLDKIIQDNLVTPKAVYGYFPCGRNGNDIEVFEPHSIKKLGSFTFPRQRSGNRYCISDFFNDMDKSVPTDLLPMQAVTMGCSASKYSEYLFKKDSYTDYLYFHGLTVQLAEALAEYIHSLIRIESGFKDHEPDNIKDILDIKYLGCRYSFGYPACPNVGDSKKQLDWLRASRVGISMDDNEQLYPEQSTTAIISFHPKAKYFGT